MKHQEEKQGSIYTPTEFTDLLASWAIREKDDRILDVGVGEGAVAFASYRRLLAVGANKIAAQGQIFGSEIDSLAFENFKEKARNDGCVFPNIKLKNFFESAFPEIDVVIGNPPYVLWTL